MTGMDLVTRKRLTVPAILAAFAVTATVWFVVVDTAPSGASAVPGAIDADTFGRTQDLSGEDLRAALDIPALTWSFDKDGAVVLSAPKGYEFLEDCGEGALRVVLGTGTAYCIPDASASAEKGFEAASAILRITQDRIPSHTELQILRLENELAFADPETPEHDKMLTELLALQDSLSSAEKTTIQEAYDRLAVDTG